MAVIRITRFTADPANTDDLLARRANLIDAVRANHPGLTDTRLARVDDETWLDVWRWESDEALQAAVAGAHALPEAPAAFALVHGTTAEGGELVDER
jgi:quinol monooxygenase YgiN